MSGEPSSESVVRKVSRRLIPFLFLLYVFAYLDRINIGFAALSMNRDLGLTATMFGLANTNFYVGYFLFEIPSNLMLARFGARVWIPRIMITWGIASTAPMFASIPLNIRKRPLYFLFSRSISACCRTACSIVIPRAIGRP